MENITNAIMAAYQESRSFSPLRSSRFSASKPLRLRISRMPKAPADITA
jgi:hypothetical protein